MDGSDELRKSGLPRIYVVPRGDKAMPYQMYEGRPLAHSMAAWVSEQAGLANLQLSPDLG